MKTVTNTENPSSNLLQMLWRGDFDIENAYTLGYFSFKLSYVSSTKKRHFYPHHSPHITLISLPKKYFKSVCHSTAVRSHLYSGLKKAELVAKYFQQLDDDDIQALYSIYYDDFQMFGYQFEFRGLRLNMPPSSQQKNSNNTTTAQIEG